MILTVNESHQITEWGLIINGLYGYLENRDDGYPEDYFDGIIGIVSYSGIDSQYGTGDYSIDNVGGGVYFGAGYYAEVHNVPGTPGVWTMTAVPIPAAVWLFGSGLGLLGWMKRKRA